MVIKLNSQPDIMHAVNLLRAGKLVAFPTETVYGLGGDASNEMAVRQIFRVKERPFDHPLIVHIAKKEQLSEWANDLTPAIMQIAEAFWPGALTMIVKKQSHVLKAVTGGQETVALRVPNHPIAQALLQAFGGGIAAPSANLFTRISPTSAEAVEEALLGKVDLILDGGLCEIGLESTIIDMTQSPPVILRKGMVTSDAISAVLGMPIAVSQQETVKAPGMHHVHYAPVTHTMLMNSSGIMNFLKTLNEHELPVILLRHTDVPLPAVKQTFYINMPNQAKAYAHELYRMLRALDREQVKHIIVEDVPDTIEWQAIRDRLQKASGQRNDKH